MMRTLILLLLTAAFAGCNCGTEPAVSLQGQMVVSETAFDYGQLTVGTSAQKTFVVRNRGSAAISVTAAVDDAEGPFSVGLEAAPEATTAVIPPDGSVTFVATFAPTAVGPATGGITVDNHGETASIALTGQGIAGAVTIDVTEIDFGDVKRDRPDTTRDDRRVDPPSQTFTIRNAGSDNFEILSAELVDDTGMFTPELDGLVGKFELAESRTGKIIFDPQGLETYEAQVKITTNSPTRPELTVDLKGRGIAQVLRLCARVDGGAEICLGDRPEDEDPLPSFAFGKHHDLEGASGSFTISNEGNLPLSVNNFVYNPSSPDITFWHDAEHTLPFDLATEKPVICPVGMADESCTDEGSRTVYVDYVARGSVCCNDGVAECVEAAGGDCNLAQVVDDTILTMLSNDPVWNAVMMRARGESHAPALVSGDFSGQLYWEAEVRLPVQNEGGAELTIFEVWLEDPSELTCGPGANEPCRCTEVSTEDCNQFAFITDPSADIVLQPDEQGEVLLSFEDPNPGLREITLVWSSTDPADPIHRTEIVVQGRGVFVP